MNALVGLVKKLSLGLIKDDKQAQLMLVLICLVLSVSSLSYFWSSEHKTIDKKYSYDPSTHVADKKPNAPPSQPEAAATPAPAPVVAVAPAPIPQPSPVSLGVTSQPAPVPPVSSVPAQTQAAAAVPSASAPAPLPNPSVAISNSFMYLRTENNIYRVELHDDLADEILDKINQQAKAINRRAPASMVAEFTRGTEVAPSTDLAAYLSGDDGHLKVTITDQSTSLENPVLLGSATALFKDHDESGIVHMKSVRFTHRDN